MPLPLLIDGDGGGYVPIIIIENENKSNWDAEHKRFGHHKESV